MKKIYRCDMCGRPLNLRANHTGRCSKCQRENPISRKIHPETIRHKILIERRKFEEQKEDDKDSMARD